MRRLTGLSFPVVFAAEYVPKLYPRNFSFSGLNFSDKSSTYLLIMVVRVSKVHVLVGFYRIYNL